MDEFQKEWTLRDAPLIFVEMVYRGDLEMKKYIGYEYKGHLFISRNQITTFYQNNRTRAFFGKLSLENYTKIDYITNLVNNLEEAKKELQIIINKINDHELAKFSTLELTSLLKSYFDAFSSFTCLYRLTRTTFYEKILRIIRFKYKHNNQSQADLLNCEFDRLNFQVDEETKTLLLALKKMGQKRMEMHSVYFDSFIRNKKLFEEIAKRTDLTIMQVQNCTLDEIIKLLKNQLIDIDEIDKRMQYFEFHYLRNNYIIKTKIKINRGNLSGSELKGQVAYPGIVKGKIQIITESLQKLDLKEIANFREKNILTARTTSPEMIPAVKKSAAILTEVGGQLSHAAILAREFKIPCIMGINDLLTRVNNDELAEVNAQKGVVTILKENNDGAGNI